MGERRYVGGQAVIEGVMMRGETSWAVAVRRPDGSIATQVHEAPSWAQRYNRFPLVRGVVALAESMSLGVRALTWSAEQAADDVDGAPQELTRAQLIGTVSVALLMFTGLFVALPAVASKSLSSRLETSLEFNVFEGLLKMTLFLGYIAAIGLISDVRRVFQYHGAEHKAIAAYENGVELTPQATERFTTQHVRCGTNFLLIVMALSIASHALFGRPSWGVLIASRILLIPIVAGLAYELIRFGARHIEHPVMRLFMAPGLALQRLTTREPDPDQVEVAIASLRAVLTAEQLAEVDARAAVPVGVAAVVPA